MDTVIIFESLPINFEKRKNERHFKTVLSLFQVKLFGEWIFGRGSACLYHYNFAKINFLSTKFGPDLSKIGCQNHSWQLYLEDTQASRYTCISRFSVRVAILHSPPAIVIAHDHSKTEVLEL